MKFRREKIYGSITYKTGRISIIRELKIKGHNSSRKHIIWGKDNIIDSFTRTRK